jgi:hypothetical protein
MPILKSLVHHSLTTLPIELKISIIKLRLEMEYYISQKHNNMKKNFWILMLALQSVIVFGQQNNGAYLTRSLQQDNINSVLVETSGGSINVSGVPAAETRVEVFVTAKNRRELSKEELKKEVENLYTLTVGVSNGKLTASAKPKDKVRDWKRSLNFTFKVYVPQHVSTDLSTSGGSIGLYNLTGEQNFTTSGGGLEIDNVKGNIKGKTSGGSITVENSSDDIDLSTSGGSIEAKNCDGKIHLSTSGGSLNLKHLKGTIEARTSGGTIHSADIAGNLTAHTSGGSIYMSELTCSLDASTSGGNINIALTTLGEFVKINNSGGNIDLQLPKGKGINLDLSADKIKTDEMNNFNGKIDDEQIVGKLNGGGVPVSARSGGRISLTLK